MRKFCPLIGALAILAAPYEARAYDDGDFQIWHTEVQEFKPAKDFKIAVEEELRWADDASEFYYQHYDAGLTYSPNKNFYATAGYRQIFELKKKEFVPEYSPYTVLGLKGELWGFKLDDKNRFEYRGLDDNEDFIRYRNRVSIGYPIKMSKFEFSPFLSNEFFFDMKDKGGFTRNRFFAGAGFKLTANISAELYYMLQSSKSSGNWTEANVFGSKVRVVF